MNNKLKAIIVVLTMMISIPVQGAAEEYVHYEQVSPFSVRIYGQIPFGEPDKMITLDVYALNKSQNDLPFFEHSKFYETIVYHNQLKSKENGMFEEEVGLPPNSGKYKIYVGFEDTENVVDTVNYLNPTDFGMLIDRFNAAAASNEIEQLLSECKDYAIFDYKFIDVDISGTSEIMLNSIKENPLSKEDFEANGKIFKKCAVIAALNNKRIGNIFNYFTDLNMETGVLKDWYYKKYVTLTTQNTVTKKLQETSINGCKNFDERIIEAFITAVILNPDGTDNACELLKAFAGNIGIDESQITRTKVAAMCGNNYSGFDDIRNVLTKSDEKSEYSSRSGGGSGGKSITISEINTTDNLPKKMNVDIYNDIEGLTWAKEAIVALTEKGILNGKGDGKFCPDDNITREEFTKLIVMGFAYEPEMKKITFDDVKQDDWYYEYIAKAYSAGIVSGYNVEKFGTGELITREDMATIAYKAKKLSSYDFKNNDEIQPKFEDMDSVSPYALDAVKNLFVNNIINGINDSEFGPKLYATRAQAAKIIYTLMLL